MDRPSAAVGYNHYIYSAAECAGAVWIADYLMMPSEGGWLIDGVTLRKPEATGV